MGSMRLRENIKLIAGAAAVVVLAALVAVGVVIWTQSQEPEVPGLVSASVDGDEPTILENESGAKIVVPVLESNEGITVSIREVSPPASQVSIGEVFDFSITDETGQDVNLDQQVEITLPYSLPEGKEHSDVVVLHWNETGSKWEPVEGGEIDQAAQTITVQVSHLSTFGISWLLSFAEFLVESADYLIDGTFEQHYEQGNKHLLAFKAAGGIHKVNGEVSLIIDVDDLLGITEEGKAGYVTTWLNLTGGLGWVSWSNTLPVGIYFFAHDRSESDDDPRFKATFKSLTGSATIGHHVVGVESLTVTNGKINPVSTNYKVCLNCTQQSSAVSLSWADLTWNAGKAEMRLRPDDDSFNALKGRFGPTDGSTVELSPEEFASEVIGSMFEVVGDEIRAILDEPSAPFTSYDQPSPEVAIDWYGSLQNQIVGHCGGENRFGPSGRLCSEGDMIFPSHTDSSGSPVVETQLKLLVKGDARETRDYFVKLVDVSPAWEIKVERGSNLWTTLVSTVLYDDRAQFEARAGAVHDIPFLVGSTSFAPNPGVATFELVHVKGFGDDEILDRYRVELWQGREVSDLSVSVNPASVEGTSGGAATLIANVTNEGPDRSDRTALHIDVPGNGNLVLSSASTTAGLSPCRTLYFGKLLCELGSLNSNQSVAVELNFDLSGSGSPGGGDSVFLQGTSTVYDPWDDNNHAASTILISPSTTPLTQPEPRPPVIQPPAPTSASDRETLIELYNATRGQYWYNNRNGIEVWEVDDESSDISSWHRVTVNSAGRVTELYLYSNDLRYDRDHRNSLPPELGNLAYLEWLDLSGNDLRGRIPDAFGNLRNLVELYLNNNSLSGNIPASLGNLTNLESLDLSDNSLSGEIPVGLGYLPRMDVVYLGGNNLSGCIPAEWRRVQGDLDELDLPFCDVALNDLTISPGRLSPEFEVSESRYTAEVPAYETTITPTNYQGASFQFLDAGNNVLTDADAARPGHQVQLTAATTTVTILVTSRDDREDDSYTVEITRSPGASGAPVVNPATPGPSTLAISWSAPSDTGTSAISSYSLRYRVARSSGGASAPWTVIQSVWNPSLGSLNHDLTGLQPSVRYELQMRAVNSSGIGPWSATTTGTTVSALPPGVPLNLTATTPGQAEIRLSWGRPSSDGGSPITGYRIQSSQDGSTWATLVPNARPGSLTYSHTALSAGSTWHYRVAAINSEGLGPWSNVATARTVLPITPQVPGPPVNPAATAEGTTVIRLTWGPPASTGSSAVSRFRLEVSEDGVRWSPLDAVGPLTTSYTHTGLSPQSARRYRVAAVNSAGLGEWSVVFSATTDPVTTLPVEPPVSGSPEGDRIALAAFYHATGGRDWERNDNWLTNAPLGEWYRVTTDSEGRVTQLYLAGNQLSGEIPEELGNLSNLEVLYLANNQFTGEIPAELGNLANLQELNLSGNQLTGEIPEELGDLTNLVALGLPGNQLTGEIPEELGNLSNLEVLDLPANELTGEIPAELGDLTNLYWLGLSGNQLTGEIPAELGGLTNLEVLGLSGNQLTGEIPAELGGLTNLVRIHLHGNQLTGEIPAELGSLTNLAGLYLANNQLTGEIPAELGGLTNLGRLHLQDNELTGEIPAELGSLTNLAGLLLYSNQLTGEIPAELGNLANLQELSLVRNQLTGEIPAELGRLTNLQVLFLSRNRLFGCIPEGLRNIRHNDLAHLQFCGS